MTIVSDIHEYQIGEYQTDMGDSISSLEGIRTNASELCDDPSKNISAYPSCNDVFINVMGTTRELEMLLLGYSDENIRC